MKRPFSYAQQEISAAADAAVRKYNEATSFEDKSDDSIANVMRAGAKEKATKLTVKMGKLLAVANPTNGSGFLHEVCTVLKNSLLLPVCSPFVIYYDHLFFLTAGGEELEFQRSLGNDIGETPDGCDM